MDKLLEVLPCVDLIKATIFVENLSKKVQDLLQIEKDKLHTETQFFFEKQKQLIFESCEKEKESISKNCKLEIETNVKLFEREKKSIENLKQVEISALKERISKLQCHY